jgi:nitroreductase
MTYSKPITEIIRSRFSCRTYAKQPIPEKDRRILREAAESTTAGPLGSLQRFELVSAEEGDSAALKGLGTYGLMRNPAGFIIGAVQEGEESLEDFGYAMESLVLVATDQGLGTCWIGGLFTRGSFSRRMQLGKDERIPAVISVGVMTDQGTAKGGTMRRWAGRHQRLPWEALFLEGGFGRPRLPNVPSPPRKSRVPVRVPRNRKNPGIPVPAKIV